jgi:hypothetical protein
MKDLQNWKISNNMDFIFCVKYVMAATDSEYRSDPNIILEEFDEIFDRITAILSFLSIDLKRRMKKKYIKLIRINDALSNIFRRLKNFKAK